MPEIDNAEQAKTLLARKLIYQSGHQVVVTEVSEFNNPDILSITRSDMFIEYEIKVSRADLMGELNSVKQCKLALLRRSMNTEKSMQLSVGGKTANASLRGNIFVDEEAEAQPIGTCSKLDKHERYLIPKPSQQNGFGFYEQPYRPNQFYFAVTQDLVALAVEVCDGLPYGVIDLNGIYGSSSIKKRAGWIHRDEPTKYQILSMARSLSFGYWSNRHLVLATKKKEGDSDQT